jgi:hypothetical protein
MFRIAGYAILSQGAVGLVLIVVAVARSIAWGPEAAFADRQDGSWSLAKRLAVTGWWLFGLAVAEFVILELSFWPVRRA